MTPADLEALLASLDWTERQARADLRARGWTDAEIEHALELSRRLDGCLEGGATWN